MSCLVVCSGVKDSQTLNLQDWGNGVEHQGTQHISLTTL